ncbi:MAG TPA: lipoprotein-releasing ABC transporter permease subunit [Smithella sp.]|nr:lipoprotein-releasing ABC transporter permease subunit [Smithella sp.]MDM7986034.1 lipoprotein-releasing ABC transporter permease subunit [Smithella sp.]HNY51000.1 lipoprotein-releasing ABC transporter permease subunit [Smithella sp.]HOG91108.1 lipoprotein-releasing ABC transporter permease subunit [Smithella sp.]HOU50888.1 lipoprotein-releasing ABC transporter permease subunit [Smithella sp.]
MSYELFISRRYLRAKRKQVFVSVITSISILGIFLGVAALIIVLAVMNGFEEDLRTKILGIKSHIELTTDMTGPMKDYQQVRQRIAGIEGVVATTPFIYSQAMLRNGNGVSGVVLRALDTQSAFKVINLGRIREGNIEHLNTIPPEISSRYAVDDTQPEGIVIGKEMARNLGIFLHDTITIISPVSIATPMGMVPRMEKFMVVGIFESGFYEYDSTLAYLSLKSCQNFLQMGDTVTGIDIKVNDIYKADVIAKSIQSRLGFPFWAQNWMQMNKNLFSALKLEKRVMFIILSLIVLVAAFNIISALIMIVMEKNKDIAILKSMGATSQSIMKIFIYQGLIIGVIGTALGCLAGLAVALNLQEVSLFVEKVFRFKFLPGDVYYLSELPSKVNYGDVVIIAVGTLLICFLSTIYPSLRASKTDPAEALRYE